MPIYEYRCDSCDHEFEKFLRAGEDEPEACPECAEASIKRLISNTSFKLEGSGWYETDYARDDEQPEGDSAASDTESEADTDESSDDETGDESADTGQAA